MKKNNLFTNRPENMTTFVAPLAAGDYTFKLPSTAFGDDDTDIVSYKKYDKIVDGEKSQRTIAMIPFINIKTGSTASLAILDENVINSIMDMEENDTVTVTIDIEDVPETTFKRNTLSNWSFNQIEEAVIEEAEQ